MKHCMEISMNNNLNCDQSCTEKTMTIWTRGVTLGLLIFSNLALGASAVEKENTMVNVPNSAKNEAQGKDRPTGLTAHSLPFTMIVSEEKLEHVPDYMGPKNPVDMDFPYDPLMIDGEYWIIYKNGYSGPVLRYKGTNIENAVRQPDGSLKTPLRGPYLLGGMWYDSSDKKLYAPIHNEANPFYGPWNGQKHADAHNVERQIHLASSTDKGLTWNYEGLIIGRDDPQHPRNPPEFSGLYWDGADGDHHLFVDERGGYVYLYSLHWLTSKAGLDAQHVLRHRVARCAMADKMAPGKWRRFYNGTWNEPGVGGKSSYVTAYRVTYNTHLKKYLSFNCSSGISVCDDLNTQAWSPSFSLGNYWCMAAMGYWVTDDTKTDVYTSGQTMFVYSFWRKQQGRRFRVSLGEGETTSDRGFISPSTRFNLSAWGVEHTVSMNPGQQYPFTPILDSEDPIDARRTRRVGCLSPEVKYAGDWTERSHPSFYEGKAKGSTVDGSSVAFSFRGKEIYWRAVQGPDQGKTDVFLDGVLQTTVDCWASETSVLRFAFIKRDLQENVPHTIKVVVRNEKNKLSSGATIQHLLFEYSAESYRASDCFSSIQGKNQWNYLQQTGGTSTNLTFRDPVWQNADGVEIGYFHLTPGGSTDAMRKWVAPRDGTVRIEGSPSLGGTKPGSMDVSIRKGTNEIWSKRLEATNLPTENHDVNIAVRAGEAIDFSVHKNPLARRKDTGDLNVLAGNIPVQLNNVNGEPLKIGSKEFAKGIFCHSNGKIMVHLSGPGKTFTAVVGVQEKAVQGTVVLSLTIDGKVAYKSEVLRGKNEGVPVKADLNGATDFVLETGDAGDGINSDWGLWADAKVILADGKEVWISDLPLSDKSAGSAKVLWDPVITYVSARTGNRESISELK